MILLQPSLGAYVLVLACEYTLATANDCSSWIVPQISLHANSSVRSAAYTSCTSSIRIAIVEIDGIFTPDITWPDLSASIRHYGLLREDVANVGSPFRKQTWSYRSAYIGHADQETCRSHRHPFSGIGKTKNMLKPLLEKTGSFTNCYIAGALHAFWLAPHIYGMELDLNHRTLTGPNNFMISILSGIDCNIPLEDIDSKGVRDLKKNWSMPPCYDRVSLPVGSVIASFELNLPPLKVLPLSIHNFDNSSCNYASLMGSWEFDLLRPKQRAPLAHWVPAFNRCKTLQASFQVKTLAPCDKSVGIIGDSNTGFMWHYGWSQLCGLPRDAFCSSNEAYNNAIKCHNSRCLIANITDVHEKCIQRLRFQRKSILFFNLGAHMPEFAPREIEENFLRPVVDEFRRLYDDGGCLVIHSVFDALFEETPAKFDHGIQWLWTNSWRTAMRNDMTRNWVAALNDSRVHYLDIFSSSLALHYDGHKDAVHFSIPESYDGMSRILYSSAVDLCGSYLKSNEAAKPFLDQIREPQVMPVTQMLDDPVLSGTSSTTPTKFSPAALMVLSATLALALARIYR